MSDKILEMLGDIRESQGRIEQKIESQVKAFEDHVADDREAYKAIIALKIGQARQKGFLTAVGAISGGVVYALGWVIEKTLGLHH